MNNSNSDQLQRFVFEQMDARGCIVRLQQTCDAIQATHHYPSSLAKVLNQFAAAVTLLHDSIKVEASVTIQLRSAGSIRLIMADCLSDRSVRAIAEYDAELLPASEEIDFNELGEAAVLAITITPDDGERYQAIVPIEHSNLEQSLENYFARSEQLPTWIRLLADSQHAVGIAIHTLPVQKVLQANTSVENFERLKALLNTLSLEESLELNSEQLLTRLFHDESCRLFAATGVQFGCHCSAGKSLDAIKALGPEDLARLVAEQRAKDQDTLTVDCHFCFQRYEFAIGDLESLLA